MHAGISNLTRKEVYRRDGYRCALCDCTHGLQVHHAIPRGHGGSNAVQNLITLWRSLPCSRSWPRSGRYRNNRRRHGADDSRIPVRLLPGTLGTLRLRGRGRLIAVPQGPRRSKTRTTSPGRLPRVLSLKRSPPGPPPPGGFCGGPRRPCGCRRAPPRAAFRAGAPRPSCAALRVPSLRGHKVACLRPWSGPCASGRGERLSCPGAPRRSSARAPRRVCAARLPASRAAGVSGLGAVRPPSGRGDGAGAK